MKRLLILQFAITLIISPSMHSQVTSNSDLYKTIMKQDSLLFNIGFNSCNIKIYDEIVSDDFKFYHDQGGVSNKSKFINDFKNGLCANPETRQVIRTLIEDSTEIFPLYENNKLYGAIQNGTHTFQENDNSQPGYARFSNTWFLENNNWKLSTSLSYDHREFTKEDFKTSMFDNEAKMNTWLKENQIPILAIGIINSGSLQQTKVYGNINAKTPAPNNTIFNVASLTKPITAVIALQLASEKKWSLDEPISKYWTDPDVINDPYSKMLTTRHILSHQTGFPNWRYQNETNKLQFLFKPGTQYSYSGEGFEYLRIALENKFKKPINTLANEMIFTPLKMNNTQYVWNDKITDHLVVSGFNNQKEVYPIYKNKKANGADDLLTTIEDYSTFLIATITKNRLSNSIFEDMIKEQVKTKNNKYFGLGFEVYTLQNGDHILSHGGSDKGVQTIFFINLKTKDGLVIFTNSDNGHLAFEPILNHYWGEIGKEIVRIEMTK